jgi:hypothetical protein
MFSSLVMFKNALTGQTQAEKADMAQRSTSLAAGMALKNDDSQYGVA